MSDCVKTHNIIQPDAAVRLEDIENGVFTWTALEQSQRSENGKLSLLAVSHQNDNISFKTIKAITQKASSRSDTARGHVATTDPPVCTAEFL